LSLPNHSSADTGPGAALTAAGSIVRVEPLGIDLEVGERETVMEAAERAGYRWPTTCYGDGTCSVCWMEILQGEDNLSAMEAAEEEGLANFSGRRFIKAPVRLACQVTCRGDAVVKKKGVVAE
jgi:ferredoxin, 2Fe-2S